MRSDEGIEITKMSVNVLIAIVFLGFAAAIYALTYNLWNALAREDELNRANGEYAKVSVFDNNIVRGQDIISAYLDSNGDIPIAFYTTDFTTAPAHVWAPSNINDIDRFKTNYSKTSTEITENTVGGAHNDPAIPQSTSTDVKGFNSVNTTDLQNWLKQYRNDVFGYTNTDENYGLYGNWTCELRYEDHACKYPAYIMVRPVS